MTLLSTIAIAEGRPRTSANSGSPAWSQQEQWVWAQLRATGEADLDQKYPGSKQDEWPKSRNLSREFLQTILTTSPYRDVLAGKQTITISGARFRDKISLTYIQIPFSLFIENSRFDAAVDMSNISSETTIAFLNSDFSSLNLGLSKIHNLVFQFSDNINELDLQALQADHLDIDGNIINNIDLSDSQISQATYITNDRISDLEMAGSVQNQIDLSSSSIGQVELDESDIHLGMFAAKLTVAGEISVSKAHIGYGGIHFMGDRFGNPSTIGTLETADSDIEGVIFLEGTEISKDLGLCCSQLGSIDIENAKIGEYLSLEGTKVDRGSDLSGITVGSDGELDEMNAQGELDLSDSTFCKAPSKEDSNDCFLTFQGSQFGSDVNLSGSTQQTLDLIGVKIGGDLDLSDVDYYELSDNRGQIVASDAVIGGKVTISTDPKTTPLERVSFQGSQIGGELDFGGGTNPVIWGPKSGLDLEYLTASSIAISSSSPPTVVEMIGTKYQSLEDGSDPAGAEQILHLLKSDTVYSPGPYDEAAAYLQRSGNPASANQILMASRSQGARGVWWLERVVLWFYGITVGYGYAPARAFFVALGFVLLGIGVLHGTKEGKRNNMPFGITYSFFTFLPLVPLEKRYDNVRLESFARYYFIIHKLVGYVLLIFLLAALSNLVPKS